MHLLAYTDPWIETVHVSIHRQSRQSEITAHTLPFMKNFQRAQAFWLPCIQQKLNTSTSLTLVTLLGQVCWRSERNCDNLTKFSKMKIALHTALNRSRQLSTTIFQLKNSSLPLSITSKSVILSPPSAFLMNSSGSFSSPLPTASCPHATFLPSTSPHQWSSIP